MRVGITGHQHLADPTWVKEQMQAILRPIGSSCYGLTSLARGADQLFAEAVLECGGAYKVILPSADYAQKFAEGADRDTFCRLLNLAASVETLSKYGHGWEAYLQAGKQIVHASELLLAVWDGRPAVGKGGTGDIAQYARQRGTPFFHLDTVTQRILFENGAQDPIIGQQSG